MARKRQPNATEVILELALAASIDQATTARERTLGKLVVSQLAEIERLNHLLVSEAVSEGRKH